MLHDVVEPAGGQDGVHPDHRLGHETDEVAGLTLVMGTGTGIIAAVIPKYLTQ